MKGWLYVISNKAVSGLVKVGSSPKDPVVYAESLERSGLPYPYLLGYEALVSDMAEAERLVTSALADRAQGKGWFKCSVTEAVSEITTAMGKAVLMESRYDSAAIADRWRAEVSSFDPTQRANALSDPGCPLNLLKFAIEHEEDETVILPLIKNPAAKVLQVELADLVDRCSGNERLIATIAKNPATPPDALYRILKADPTEDILLELFRNPSFPEEGFEDTACNYYENVYIYEAVSVHPNCPTELLANICWLSPNLRETIRLHANWDESAFLNLLHRESKDWPDWVAEDPISAEMMRALSRSPFPAVVQAVARNTKCPADLLISLASSEWREVRAAIAGRQDCPEEVIRQLAEDGAAEVRCAVLENPRCPHDLLETFASSSLYEWRIIVAELEKCPEDILERLKRDPEPSVRNVANRRNTTNLKASTKGSPESTETIEVIRERFRQFVRRTLGALIDESELLRLASLPANEKDAFIEEFPSHAKQLALFEKHLLPKLQSAAD